ncbi:MAG TPA: CRTAC1 family protein [Pirellulales bacterium]|nr:CRTAC1 family protein [Pirellulales bacterium]
MKHLYHGSNPARQSRNPCRFSLREKPSFRGAKSDIKFSDCAVKLAVCAALLAAGCERRTPIATETSASARHDAAGAAAQAVVPFVDKAQTLGIEFGYHDGAEAHLSTMLESLGGGVGWLDFDRDGWLDLAATGGGSFPSERSMVGRASALFRNLGGKKFVSAGASAGIETPELFTNGLAVADYDNDGFEDLLITGYGRPQLWRNMGDGTFREQGAAAGILDDRWGSSAAWADFNGDGNLDLYLAHYVNWSFDNHPVCYNKPGHRDNCPPRDFEPLPDSVYYSLGDGRFTDATERAALRDDGKGLGVLLCDVDIDRDIDIYVANDTTDNFLYLNDGTGKFAEVGMAAGVACSERGTPDGSMGVDLCDFNGDGLPDLWVANYERETFALYRNEGHGRFLHVSQRLGITDLGGLFVGFGTACEDFDSDGDEDMIVANGHVIKYSPNAPRKQLPLLLQYDGRRFQRAPSAPGSYFGDPHEGRGLAVADFDLDGDLDLAVSDLKDSLALLENRFRDDNRCLALTLIGVRSNRDAVGALVELRTSAGTRFRQVTGGGSYLSHSARSLYFALPKDSEAGTLVVHWPSGLTQTLDARSLAGQVTLLEPVSEGEPSPRLSLGRNFSDGG